MSLDDAPDADVKDFASPADAYAEYARLRSQCPVHRATLPSGMDGWLVVGYEEAREALTHPALLKNPAPAAESIEAAGYKPGRSTGAHMLEADPPHHTRLRKLVSGAFTAKRTAALGPRIEQIANELIDRFPATGEIDLVTRFTAPLPATVNAELLGIPHDDRAEFAELSNQIFKEGYRAAGAALYELLAKVVADKRRMPADDLVSALVAAHDSEDGSLTEQELIGTAMLLVVAGHETTTNLLGNGLLALLQHPDQLQLLLDRPELMPDAVEEFLRYDSPAEHSTHRYAAEDLELGGRFIPRGSAVLVALISANRDAPLPEGKDPDVLDISGPAGRHLAFGHGIHHCLGAPLARLEAAIALRTLLTRISGLELAVAPEDIEWNRWALIRGAVRIPVSYRAVQR